MAKEKNKDRQKNTPVHKPKEGEDYYIQNGFLVFTAFYLQKRGYCCQSGCRHCPYGFYAGRKG